MHAQSTATSKPTFKPRVRRLDAGRYLVESASCPGRGHTTMATSCSCTGFSYRRHCKHVALIQALEPAMQQWYGQVTPAAPVVVPMTAGAPSGLVRPVQGNPTAGVDAQIDDAESRLASARWALQDADLRDDSYAVLWRQVDGLERAVAALHWQSMRAA
jgi:hypothetical protein